MDVLKSIWAFLSVFVIAWITQRIVRYWEKRKKVEETKLSLYMSWMPFFAECYARAFEPTDSPFDKHEFVRKKMEILGTLQIMGPDGALDSFCSFCDLAEKGIRKDASFDGKRLHESFTRLNYCLCCEIHGESPKNDAWPCAAANGEQGGRESIRHTALSTPDPFSSRFPLLFILPLGG